jgi:hypothetical protein
MVAGVAESRAWSGRAKGSESRANHVHQTEKHILKPNFVYKVCKEKLRQENFLRAARRAMEKSQHTIRTQTSTPRLSLHLSHSPF